MNENQYLCNKCSGTGYVWCYKLTSWEEVVTACLCTKGNWKEKDHAYRHWKTKELITLKTYDLLGKEKYLPEFILRQKHGTAWRKKLKEHQQALGKEEELRVKEVLEKKGVRDAPSELAMPHISDSFPLDGKTNE